MTPLIYLLIVLGVVCAAWAMAPQPSVSFPKSAVSSTLGPPEPVSKVRVLGENVRLVLSHLLSRLGNLIPHPPALRDGLKERRVETGVNLTKEQLAGIQLLSAAGCAFIVFIVAREVGEVQPLWVGLAGAFGFILPRLWLKSRVQRRQRAIIRLLPEVIDLLSLSIGAGLDFLGALNKVVFLKTFKKEPLIEELSVVLQEIKLGKRRFEALKALAKRVNVSEVSSFVRTLVQADRMGTPIGEVLTIHSEDIRFERFMRAERAALKAPIKILIPLIFFIMPCVAIVVGAPIFLQFMTQNLFGK